LINHVSLPRFQPLRLEVQLIYFGIQVQRQLFYSGHHLGIGFPQCLYLMALVVAVDHTFRAYWGREAIEAEVVDLFFWVFLTRFTLRPELPPRF
jgi:hypothetical protein